METQARLKYRIALIGLTGSSAITEKPFRYQLEIPLSMKSHKIATLSLHGCRHCIFILLLNFLFIADLGCHELKQTLKVSNQTVREFLIQCVVLLMRCHKNNNINDTPVLSAVNIYAANRCSPVPEVQHAVPDSNLAVQGLVIHYTCVDGFVPSTLPFATTTCDGISWMPAQPSGCKGLQFSSKFP